MENLALKSENVINFEIEAEKNILLKSISKLQSLVEKRNTIPILSNVKLEASGGNLKLTVTDMDIVASEIIEANIISGGALTVPALTLYDIIRKSPEGIKINLVADAESSVLKVKAGRSKFTLSYLPAEDFPVMSEGEFSNVFKCASREFLKLIDRTKFAMSNEETRYYLNGVYFHVSNGRLRAVATDGHRLSSVFGDLPEGAVNMPGVIIPRKAVNELSKLLENTDEVEISVSESKIKFKSGAIEILSKVVDGTFPDYQRVIPENNSKLLKISSDEFKEAVDRISTISIDKTKAIKVSISDDKISFNSQGNEGTSGNEELAAEYSGEPLNVGFNSRYLLEMMSLLDSDNVNILLENSNSPVIFSNPNDSDTIYIIMPMRV